MRLWFNVHEDLTTKQRRELCQTDVNARLNEDQAQGVPAAQEVPATDPDALRTDTVDLRTDPVALRTDPVAPRIDPVAPRTDPVALAKEQPAKHRPAKHKPANKKPGNKKPAKEKPANKTRKDNPSITN